MEAFLQQVIPKKILDPELYEKAKATADTVHSRPSAYKSMFILEEYKRMGGRVDESKSNHGLRRWIDEDWRNLTPFGMGLTSREDTPKCGQRHPLQGKLPSVCRPYHMIKTYSKLQVQKAIRIKEKGGVISWSML